jgi:hypothetical protein
MKAVFTIEQIDGKLVITIEQAEPILKEQDGIDWSKPVAFPKGYSIPKGVRIIVLEDDHKNIDIGERGITTNCSKLPSCSFKCGTEQYAMHSYELAPINPTDHPLHPNFKGNK